MRDMRFGWDYWNYSKQPEIKDIIQRDFSGFSPDGVYPNDSDTLPLFDSNYQPTNAWHNIVNIVDQHIEPTHTIINKDTVDFIKDNETFRTLATVMADLTQLEVKLDFFTRDTYLAILQVENHLVDLKALLQLRHSGQKIEGGQDTIDSNDA